VKAKWGFGSLSTGVIRPKKDRLRKLAASLDALASHDEKIIRRAHEIGSLRRQAAMELHGVCADFVRDLNELLAETALDFDPAVYSPGHFQEDGVNLFQINARGRILQIEFESTPELTSTENFRVPYILEGAVRSFNQQSLERLAIEEQSLFYTIQKTRNLWRFFDARTYRSGIVDANYLTSLMEELV